MEKKSVTFVIVMIIMSVSVIGVGLAYDSSVYVESDITSRYCAISADVGGYPINGVSIIVDYPEDSEPRYNLSFAYDGGIQETLSLHYHHTEGTDLILSISFVMSGLDAGDQTIICYNGTNIVGSTVLSGTGEKNGTISGIILGLENKKIDDVFDCRFEIQGINSVEGISVQMSFSVHPLEVSS